MPRINAAYDLAYDTFAKNFFMIFLCSGLISSC